MSPSGMMVIIPLWDQYSKTDTEVAKFRLTVQVYPFPQSSRRPKTDLKLLAQGEAGT